MRAFEFGVMSRFMLVVIDSDHSGIAAPFNFAFDWFAGGFQKVADRLPFMFRQNVDFKFVPVAKTLLTNFAFKALFSCVPSLVNNFTCHTDECVGAVCA